MAPTFKAFAHSIYFFALLKLYSMSPTIRSTCARTMLSGVKSGFIFAMASSFESSEVVSWSALWQNSPSASSCFINFVTSIIFLPLFLKCGKKLVYLGLSGFILRLLLVFAAFEKTALLFTKDNIPQKQTPDIERKNARPIRFLTKFRQAF